MQMTISEAMQKISNMQTIVDKIENGDSIENHLYDISLLLDEYAAILLNTKVKV